MEVFMNKRFKSVIVKLGIKLPFWESKIKNDYSWDVLKDIVEQVNNFANIEIVADGLENIPDKTFMIFSNHISTYDPAVAVATLNVPVGFVLKEELKEKKIIDLIASKTNSEYLARNDLRKTVKSMNNVYDKLMNNQNFLIYPEGTRNKNLYPLLDFKPGAFKSAMKAKVDIVPCCIFNTQYVMDDDYDGKLQVFISYLSPLTYEQYKDLSTKEVAQIVQSKIQNKLDEFRS